MSRPFRGRPEPDESESQGESLETPDDSESWQNRVQSYKYGGEQKILAEATQVDIGKRLVAAMIDIAVGYVLGLAINIIPFINSYFNAQVVMILYLMCRDALFGGRGVGKNLMGLQVVDKRTRAPASMLQSIQRNIVLYGPALALYIFMPLLSLIPIDQVRSFLSSAMQAVGGVYSFIVIPYEAYRVYSRPDGTRWGDQFAGTVIILADMDFSSPHSK